MLHVQVHDCVCWHHIGIEIRHDDQRAADHQRDDKHAESERQHVVGVIRSRRDVKEEHEVDAHLGDGEYGKA